jgi:hypothetical protein
MELFHIQCADFDDFAIFANGRREANRLAAQHLQGHSAKDTHFMVSHPVSFSHLTFKECRDLKSASAMNEAGLGVYDAQDGWKIVPVARQSFAMAPKRIEKRSAKLHQTITAIGQASGHPSYAA